MIYSAPAQTFQAVLENAPTGLVGTMGVRLLKASDGSTVTARVTTGIIEIPAGSGTYIATMTAPSTLGEYVVFWDQGSVTPSTTADEELQVTQTLPASSTPAAGDLVTLAEVREHLQMQAAETEQDAVIQSLITRMSKAIPRAYRREFAPPTPNPTTRRFKVSGDLMQDRRGISRYYLCDLAPFELQSATLVKLHPEAASPITLTAGTDYALSPPQATLDGTYTDIRLFGSVGLLSTNMQRFGYSLLDVTGTWGFASVPADVKEAAILAVVMHIRGDVQGFGSALQPNSLGTGVNAAEALPPGVRGLLTPYMRDVMVR